MGICINFSKDIPDTKIEVNIDKNKIQTEKTMVENNVNYNQFNDQLTNSTPTCYLCKKTIHSINQKNITCFYCNQIIGHKSCVSYRMLLTPNCPFCNHLIKPTIVTL